MAADEDREAAALEWSEALIGNTILEQLEQPGERDASVAICKPVAEPS